MTHLFLWLKASGERKGPVFPKIRNWPILRAFQEIRVNLDQRTIKQWINEANQFVHMWYDEFHSTTINLFSIISILYKLPEYTYATPYSYRRSACVWSARCGAREFEIRFTGRWDCSSRHFSSYMEEEINMHNLS